MLLKGPSPARPVTGRALNMAGDLPPIAPVTHIRSAITSPTAHNSITFAVSIAEKLSVHLVFGPSPGIYAKRGVLSSARHRGSHDTALPS